jgi:hypothetical protein
MSAMNWNWVPIAQRTLNPWPLTPISVSVAIASATITASLVQDGSQNGRCRPRWRSQNRLTSPIASRPSRASGSWSVRRIRSAASHGVAIP